jgi:hypothetical protein
MTTQHQQFIDESVNEIFPPGVEDTLSDIFVSDNGDVDYIDSDEDIDEDSDEDIDEDSEELNWVDPHEDYYASIIAEWTAQQARRLQAQEQEQTYDMMPSSVPICSSLR